MEEVVWSVFVGVLFGPKVEEMVMLVWSGFLFGVLVKMVVVVWSEKVQKIVQKKQQRVESSYAWRKT